MKFFLPNFEDLVDPDYNFLSDSNSPKREDRFEHDWYAHQFFDTPIFDGVLMSKTVISSSIREKIIKKGSIHKFLRLDNSIPILGDCGAYSYSKKENPPYSTNEILDYYEELGFDIGVSVDHVIFNRFDAKEKERRWKITLNNAIDFIKQHRSGDYSFTPVGIAQGESPEMYAETISKLVEVGYENYALGGLARSGDKTIKSVLKAISTELPDGAELHLFGVARLSMIPDLIKYGVTMVDSSSPLRRAFLGDNDDNYWLYNGTKYAAIRVPYAKKGAAKKRGINSTEAILNNDKNFSFDDLKILEQTALKKLRGYDRGEVDLDEVLEKVLLYDHLHGKARNKGASYRRTLAEKPWEKCACSICQEIGIEVIIFRGNNRNRRRGFHNVKVFYDHFKKTVSNVQNEDYSTQDEAFHFD